MIRAVVDTNILVRAVIKPHGTVGPILERLAQGRYCLLYNEASLEELIDVLGRPRLRNRFAITDGDVRTVLDLIGIRGEEVPTVWNEAICRDPKDDKFLGLMIDGQADVLVTTDQDLLVLHPFRGVPILGAFEFLQMLEEDPGQSHA